MNNKNQQIKELTEHNDELENYFRNTIIPQFFIDANLIVRKFTPAAMKQFNLTQDDIGKSINDVIDNLRFPSVTENIHRVIDSKEILEKEIQTTDSRWYQMNILPYIKQIDNTTNGVIITFVEITLRIRDLEDLHNLISAHETLLDTISHDIKNPINNILLTIDSLKSDYPDQFINKPLLKIIENGVNNIHNIINEQTISRKQKHPYKAYNELLRFENILEDVRLTLLDNINKSGAIITSELNVPEITFSRRELRSIIYNLLNNAIKFKSPERKPEIFIRTIREDNFIILSIRDNGIGIDATKHEDIFSKYFRIEDSLEGSGIGLFLVKEFVTKARGKILVESQIDKGTEFKIYLKSKVLPLGKKDLLLEKKDLPVRKKANSS